MTSSNYSDLGYIRVVAIAPPLTLADPIENAKKIIAYLNHTDTEGASIVVFPELAITGYSCEDLFFSDDLQKSGLKALKSIAKATRKIVCVVGTPYLTDDGRLLNCAAVLSEGELRGLIPKIALPNYGEFYEQRWFSTGKNVDIAVKDKSLGNFRICSKQVFNIGDVGVGIELCEDLWSPEPPGIGLCLAGADILVNLSASNELVGKAEYRKDLVKMASAKGICGYVYSSSGLFESSKDLVFGGHLVSYENGVLLGESERFQTEGTVLVSDIDIDRIRHDRIQNRTFGNASRDGNYYRIDALEHRSVMKALHRKYQKHPFIPDEKEMITARAEEILQIQSAGLARRVKATNTETLVLGLSGGLDSTLALLVCLDTAKHLGLDNTSIHAITMPGPGTSELTLRSARELAKYAKVTLTEIPIDQAVEQHLKDLNHTELNDTVFENAQTRERTQILFNYANKVEGLVVGTGDLSELALGWCTYNADHMASYNVNASVPKTLIAYLVRWYANDASNPSLSKILETVLNTPISPELLAVEAGDDIAQKTESIIGPFELHDFFLYHYLRNGASVPKIFALAQIAFGDQYKIATLKKWMAIFYRRFFTQQFKRTTLPAGPKVGTVSLSPRGDWRMPDEASVDAILDQIRSL